MTQQTTRFCLPENIRLTQAPRAEIMKAEWQVLRQPDRGRRFGPRALRLLRKVNGVPQVEIAELMVGAYNYANSYVEALILGTSKDQLT